MTQLMRLPKCSQAPNYNETHARNEWCDKVGCTPVCDTPKVAIYYAPKHLGWGIWYVSDLPGHNGTKRIKEGPEVNSDWGFTKKREQAITLSPYWQRRVLKYARDCNHDIRLENAVIG